MSNSLVGVNVDKQLALEMLKADADAGAKPADDDYCIAAWVYLVDEKGNTVVGGNVTWSLAKASDEVFIFDEKGNLQGKGPQKVVLSTGDDGRSAIYVAAYIACELELEAYGDGETGTIGQTIAFATFDDTGTLEPSYPVDSTPLIIKFETYGFMIKLPAGEHYDRDLVVISINQQAEQGRVFFKLWEDVRDGGAILPYFALKTQANTQNSISYFIQAADSTNATKSRRYAFSASGTATAMPDDDESSTLDAPTILNDSGDDTISDEDIKDGLTFQVPWYENRRAQDEVRFYFYLNGFNTNTTHQRSNIYQLGPFTIGELPNRQPYRQTFPRQMFDDYARRTEDNHRMKMYVRYVINDRWWSSHFMRLMDTENAGKNGVSSDNVGSGHVFREP